MNPKVYRKFVIYESKDQAPLHVKTNKALYGLLQSMLVFYKKLVKDLEWYGFKLNSYNLCMTNATINGHQMTMTWHVNELKVSHIDPFEITKFIVYLSGIYGGELTFHRRKVNDCIDLNYPERGAVKVSMVEYMHTVFKEFPEKLNGTFATPAAGHLLQVRDEGEAKYLPEEQAQAQVFHHVTVQLIFVSSREHMDIQTAVAFLTTSEGIKALPIMGSHRDTSILVTMVCRN